MGMDMTMVGMKRAMAFLGEHLNLSEATDEEGAAWERFQLVQLQLRSPFGIMAKSRQVGWSWLAAAEAVAIGCTKPRATSIFVSLNHKEAAEKIRYARQIVEALRPIARPQLIIDSQLELEFHNGARLISHPCRPVRGKAKAHVYLDEFAHYPNDREVYVSALPTATRGGQLRIGSSPLSASGLFWEIYTQKLRAYPGFVRQSVPWWRVAALCTNVAQAESVAPSLLTAERVGRFASARLRLIYDNLLLEDFQQEYECAWVDEATAWITWEEIKRNQRDAASEAGTCLIASGINQALTAIHELADLVAQCKIEPTLAGGLDIGRTRNTTELFLVGRTDYGGTPLRLMVTLDNVEFADQQAVVDQALTDLPITKLFIDRTGLGMQLAEQCAARHGIRAEGVAFTNDLKEAWSVELKVQLQKGLVPLPLDRDLTYQLHSLKKQISPAKNLIFDTASSEKHHADKYWALALAVYAARPASQPRYAVWGPNPVRDPRDRY